ncbi:MAG: non-heme iron oxygenase ferredoxin subunit [Planctomycetaceae bacterium]
MTEKIANLNEVPAGGRKSVIVDETPALLLRAGDDYYCLEDVCTHDGQPLTDGPVVDGAIECPRHGARFDMRTGAPLCMPATEPVRVFTVEVREDGVYAIVD